MTEPTTGQPRIPMPFDLLGRSRFCVGVRFDYPWGDVVRVTVWAKAWGRMSAAMIGLWRARRDADPGWSRITLESVDL